MTTVTEGTTYAKIHFGSSLEVLVSLGDEGAKRAFLKAIEKILK